MNYDAQFAFSPPNSHPMANVQGLPTNHYKLVSYPSSPVGSVLLPPSWGYSVQPLVQSPVQGIPFGHGTPVKSVLANNHNTVFSLPQAQAKIANKVEEKDQDFESIFKRAALRNGIKVEESPKQEKINENQCAFSVNSHSSSELLDFESSLYDDFTSDSQPASIECQVEESITDTSVTSLDMQDISLTDIADLPLSICIDSSDRNDSTEENSVDVIGSGTVDCSPKESSVDIFVQDIILSVVHSIINVKEENEDQDYVDEMQTNHNTCGSCSPTGANPETPDLLHMTTTLSHEASVFLPDDSDLKSDDSDLISEFPGNENTNIEDILIRHAQREIKAGNLSLISYDEPQIAEEKLTLTEIFENLARKNGIRVGPSPLKTENERFLKENRMEPKTPSFVEEASKSRVITSTCGYVFEKLARKNGIKISGSCQSTHTQTTEPTRNSQNTQTAFKMNSASVQVDVVKEAFNVEFNEWIQEELSMTAPEASSFRALYMEEEEARSEAERRLAVEMDENVKSQRSAKKTINDLKEQLVSKDNEIEKLVKELKSQKKQKDNEIKRLTKDVKHKDEDIKAVMCVSSMKDVVIANMKELAKDHSKLVEELQDKMNDMEICMENERKQNNCYVNVESVSSNTLKTPTVDEWQVVKGRSNNTNKQAKTNNQQPGRMNCLSEFTNDDYHQVNQSNLVKSSDIRSSGCGYKEASSQEPCVGDKRNDGISTNQKSSGERPAMPCLPREPRHGLVSTSDASLPISTAVNGSEPCKPGSLPYPVANRHQSEPGPRNEFQGVPRIPHPGQETNIPHHALRTPQGMDTQPEVCCPSSVATCGFTLPANSMNPPLVPLEYYFDSFANFGTSLPPPGVNLLNLPTGPPPSLPPPGVNPLTGPRGPCPLLLPSGVNPLGVNPLTVPRGPCQSLLPPGVNPLTGPRGICPVPLPPWVNPLTGPTGPHPMLLPFGVNPLIGPCPSLPPFGVNPLTVPRGPCPSLPPFEVNPLTVPPPTEVNTQPVPRGPCTNSTSASDASLLPSGIKKQSVPKVSLSSTTSASTKSSNKFSHFDKLMEALRDSFPSYSRPLLMVQLKIAKESFGRNGFKGKHISEIVDKVGEILKENQR